MTVETIVSVITVLVTYIMAEVVKKFKIANVDMKDFIPIQNVLIGIIAGAIVYASKLAPDILTATIICLSSSMCAGGTYDLIQVAKGDDDIER